MFLNFNTLLWLNLKILSSVAGGIYQTHDHFIVGQISSRTIKYQIDILCINIVVEY